ncbi:RNA polymerase sigma factor [Spirillospora albida]|uniref:RNA polymerase sigma factor n=1 Tax=Spirillospora albida TaxID=58123 RepID=UPI0004C1597E|nr:sigma-70 region 4 domain-containing protein [Spirillospora albida]
MRGDSGSLYDAHAARLYAHCWSLVGDRAAAAALADTFAAAVHQPPRGDRVLWLHSLARAACASHGDGGPFGEDDALLRAAGTLRPDQREVLLLWAGEWLETHDIARVLGIAPDTVAQLLAAARTRLERAVLDILMRGTDTPEHDLITAFEKGRLPQLLARRAPSAPPPPLRDEIIAACEREAARLLPSVAAPAPLIVIGDGGTRERRAKPRGLSRGLSAVAGLAASAAAVVGLLISWPMAKGGPAASLVPTSGSGTPDLPSAEPAGHTPAPDATPGAGRGPSENRVTSAHDGEPEPAGPPSNASLPAPGARPAAPPPGTPEASPAEPSKPAKPKPIKRPVRPPTPTAPPETPPAPVPDDSTPPPATTPPAETPSEPPSPAPTAGPSPEPAPG